MSKKRRQAAFRKLNQVLEDHPVYGALEWKILKRFVNKFFGKVCLRCGKTTGMFHADHVMPYAMGKSRKFDPTNLQQLCAPCNRWKGGRHMEFRTQTPSPADLIRLRVEHLVPGYKPPRNAAVDASASIIRIRDGIRTKITKEREL